MMGGLSCIFQPYAKANNKHCEDYDEAEPTSYITYVDANSLYPYAMTLPMPVGDYEKIPLLEDQSARMVFLQTIFGRRAHENNSRGIW